MRHGILKPFNTYFSLPVKCYDKCNLYLWCIYASYLSRYILVFWMMNTTSHIKSTQSREISHICKNTKIMHNLFLRSNLNVSHDNLRIDKKEIPWDYPTCWSFISNTFVTQIYGKWRVNYHYIFQDEILSLYHYRCTIMQVYEVIYRI